MSKESASIWADIKKYEDMLANDPKSYCFTLLSELYRKLGLLEDAINTAKRGIDVHPEYIGGYVAIGRAFFEKGMKEESINALEKVVRVTPENILAQKLLSQMYIDRGEVESAIRSLNLIQLLNPEDVESRLMLEALKNPAVAREEESADSEADTPPPAVEAITVDEEGFVLIDEILEAGLSEEDAEDVPEFKETEELSARSPLSTATLAELYVSQGFLQRAINVYTELLEKEPDNMKFSERLKELECLTAAQEIESAKQEGEVQEGISDIRDIPITSDLYNEKLDFASGIGNSDVIISTLEHWLENIRRGRYGAEGDAQRHS